MPEIHLRRDFFFSQSSPESAPFFFYEDGSCPGRGPAHLRPAPCLCRPWKEPSHFHLGRWPFLLPMWPITSLCQPGIWGFSLAPSFPSPHIQLVTIKISRFHVLGISQTHSFLFTFTSVALLSTITDTQRGFLRYTHLFQPAFTIPRTCFLRSSSPAHSSVSKL